jgi:hypothetical protein
MSLITFCSRGRLWVTCKQEARLAGSQLTDPAAGSCSDTVRCVVAASEGR